MTPMIEVQNLSKQFGQTAAVAGLSLQVEAGEIYGLVGPDGAGKTTTIRLLCGALRPTSGEATIAGFPLARQPEQAREQIGYLAQRFSLYEDLTVLENLRFFAEVRGLSRQQWRPRSMEILDFVGLREFSDRRAAQLSGGMKQKLGLAAALVHNPRVLLLDEPTTGVDPVTRQDFWQLIIRLATDEGVAILISTPYMDEAVRCRRLGFMRHGRLLREGTPAQLRTGLQGRIFELQGQPLALLRQAAAADESVEDAQMFGDRIHLRIQSGQAEAISQRLPDQAAALGGQVTRLRPVSPQLEDVFLALLGDAGQREETAP